MQSKTYLPPIKYLLDSPIDDASSFNFPSIQQQSSLINYNNNNNNNGNGNNNNNVYISSYLPSINESSQAYKRLMNSNDIHRHPNNNNNSCSSSHASIKSLLSPPESPDMTTSHQQSLFNNYASHNHHNNNYNHHSQPQSQQIVNHPCSCCIKPSSPTLPFIYSSQSSSRYVPYHYQYSQDPHNHHNHHHQQQQQQQQQRYHNSFPSTIQPIPISPFDHRKQLSITTSPTSTSTSSLILQPNLPRISTISSNLTSTPTTKHFTPKSLHPLSCSPTTSSNCNGNRYQCQYCSKRFSRPSSLRIHTYSHTGEKPFVCSEPGCGRKFSVQSNMRRHLRVHKLGRPVKKTRYDGEVEGVKMLSPAKITRNYL